MFPSPAFFQAVHRALLTGAGYAVQNPETEVAINFCRRFSQQDLGCPIMFDDAVIGIDKKNRVVDGVECAFPKMFGLLGAEAEGFQLFQELSNFLG